MTPRDLLTAIIIVTVAVIIVGGTALLTTQPTQVERQIAADHVSWVEISSPPDSNFDRCWVGTVGEGTALRAFVVCK